MINFLILLMGISLGIVVTYLYYYMIPKIKNPHWRNGYNEGIRDYHKASEWAKEINESINWD